MFGQHLRDGRLNCVISSAETGAPRAFADGLLQRAVGPLQAAMTP